MSSRLTICLDCGGTLSSGADRCPHCASSYPHGVVCLVCKDTLPEKAALRQAKGHPQRLGHNYHRSSFQTRRGQYGYHADCVVKLFAIPSDVHCPDCGVQLASRIPFESILHVIVEPPPTGPFETGPLSRHLACPNCGCPNALRCLGSCLACALPICASLHDCLIRQSREPATWQYWRRTMARPESLHTLRYNNDGWKYLYPDERPFLKAVGFHRQCAPAYLTICCDQVFEVSRYRSATHCSKCGRRLQKQLCAICREVLLADDPETIVRRSGMLFRRRTEYYHRECVQRTQRDRGQT